MSLILDALNRADQERSEENSTPNIHRGHNPYVKPPSPIRRWIIEAVVILLVVIVLIYFQWPQESSTPNKTILPSDRTAVTNSEAFASTGDTDIKPPETNTSVENLSQTTKPVAAKSLTEIVQNPSITSLYKDKKQTTDKVSGNEKIQTTKDQVKPDNKIVTKPAVKNVTQNILQQIPLLSELPLRFQQAVPNIDYSVHVYSEKNNGGFVNLNGSIRKVGAEISPGLRVIAILKDSVVLEYKGNQFRLAALNSWVNYN